MVHPAPAPPPSSCSRQRRRRPLPLGPALPRALLLAAAGVLTLALQLGAWRPHAAVALESAMRDAIARVVAVGAEAPHVALIDIDEDSLSRVEPWPWPRSRLADLAEALLDDYGARLVVLDLVLPEPADAGGDARLARLARAGRVVTAQALDYVRREPPLAVGVPGGAIMPGTDAANAAWPAQATGHLANHAGLGGALCTGNVGFVPDPDGRVRRLPLLSRLGSADSDRDAGAASAGDGALYPTLALAALRCAEPRARDARWLANLPVTPDGMWQPVPRHAPSAWRAASAADVLDLAVEPAAALVGRIAIVGSSALGLADRVATPLAPAISGMAVHAAAIEDLYARLEGRALPPPPRGLPTGFALGALALLGWAIVRGARLRTLLALVGAQAAASVGLAAWAVRSSSIEPVSGVAWGMAVLLLALLPHEWASARARVAARTRLLSQYVAQPVLDELLSAEGGPDPLVPRRVEITVLTADMENYTGVTRDNPLDDVAALTREFLACLTEPVWRHRGTLDRYTGDGLVAFWGAPLPVADHADRAVDAALDILERVARYNRERLAGGRFPVRVRLGIASGPALVGDLGTPLRRTYTAVGDCINLAARLEGLARDAGHDLLVAAGTARRLTRHRSDRIAALEVRGLGEVEVHAVRGATASRSASAGAGAETGLETGLETGAETGVGAGAEARPDAQPPSEAPLSGRGQGRDDTAASGS